MVSGMPAVAARARCGVGVWGPVGSHWTSGAAARLRRLVFEKAGCGARVFSYCAVLVLGLITVVPFDTVSVFFHRRRYCGAVQRSKFLNNHVGDMGVEFWVNILIGFSGLETWT